MHRTTISLALFSVLSTNFLHFSGYFCNGNNRRILTAWMHNREVYSTPGGKGILTVYFVSDERHYVSLTFGRTYCGYCREGLSVRTLKYEPDAGGMVHLRCILDVCPLEVFVDGGRHR
jgi:hypothetical protein